MTHAFAISLAIPDNTAFTARETLQRLGLPLGALKRSDLWTFEAQPEAAAPIAAWLQRTETLFNPNKHAFAYHRERPAEGEVWIESVAQTENVVGKASGIPEGVRSAKHFTAWQLSEPDGSPAKPLTIEAAVSMLLCNPAIERAIR